MDKRHLLGAVTAAVGALCSRRGRGSYVERAPATDRHRGHGPRGAAVGAGAKFGGGRTGHSFAPGSLVLMADGTIKAIEDTDVGDEVTATDPQTGATRPD